MTDAATQAASTEVVHQPERPPALTSDAHAHPTPRQYVVIAIVLVVITGVEVAVSYIDGVNTNLIIVILMALAAVKFFLVVAWYMHLRTDKRMFSYVFTVALIAAGVLYFVVLTSLLAFASLES